MALPQRHVGETAHLAELAFAGVATSQLASTAGKLRDRTHLIDHSSSVNMGWPNAYGDVNVLDILPLEAGDFYIMDSKRSVNPS